MTKIFNESDDVSCITKYDKKLTITPNEEHVMK